jgi:hypothetical protein
MALELDSLPGPLRKELIETGRYFASEDTLDQANQTLGALVESGELIADFGFGEEDKEDLTEGRDLLVDAGVARADKRAGKKTTSAKFVAALKKGKNARRRSRAVLGSGVQQLRKSSDALSQTAAQEARAVLEGTRRAEANPEKLATQLDQLKAELSKEPMAAAVARRGGPAAVTLLTESATELRAATASKATPRGTPDQTERLDLLDGIIVGLVRSAREAARSAANELGRPAVAKAFELKKLYRRSGSSAPATTDEPALTDEPAETPAETTDESGS